jgi:two-component system, NtrC family, nitrogen regulation sensor histidine kinase GlnL
MTSKTKPSKFDVPSLIENLSTAVVLVDTDLNVFGSNVAAENLLEVSAIKMHQMSLAELFNQSEEIERLANAVKSEECSYTERDLKLVTPSMKRIVVDCTISPWGDAKEPGFRIIVELSSVERHQRIQSEEAMLMQNQATAALLRGLAHEVKNPLGGIRGAAQLLERELEDPNHHEYTQIIIGEADRLRKLVDRMLGPRGQLKRESTNIHEVLEHVRNVVLAEHGDGVTLERDYDPSLPPLLVNRDELVQAFLNLVRNAMQAVGPKGKVTIRTRVKRSITIANKLHRLVLSTEIIDDGPGVDESIAESIFFPMVSGRADGSGLGLPLSQGIVNRYGGLIGFTSDPGNTVFTVWLPTEANQ